MEWILGLVAGAALGVALADAAVDRGGGDEGVYRVYVRGRCGHSAGRVVYDYAQRKVHQICRA